MRKSPFLLLTFLLTFSLGCFLISCSDSNNSADNDSGNNIKPVPAISYSILSTVPHDTSYFTEGLEFYQNTIMESTGLNGKSKLVQSDPKTGKMIREINLERQYFGEGITILNDTIYQLTWQEHVVFVYTAKDFKKVKELPLSGQGWGLTNDGKQLIASNGSSDLLFYEPQTFKLLKTVTVTERGTVVPNINELEYVNGYVYANIWQQNYIYKIDPNTGEVVGKMDLSDIVSRARMQYVNAEVLNGIAYNPSTQKFYVTGKNWPLMYEVAFGQ